MNQKFKYRWTDAWLLASIVNASKNGFAELWEIIAEGDNLNHAIFTDEEIESGLTRLAGGGWIRKENGKFLATEKFKKTGLKKLTVTSLKILENLLEAESWNPNEQMPHPANNLQYPGVSKDDLKKAHEKYRKNA